MNKKYGWKRDLPSHHDNILLTPHESIVAKFPSKKFLGNLPPVYDQGQLGSCTANALAGVFEFEQIKQGLVDFTPSRLFIYYNERSIEGTVGADAGAALSDGIKSLLTCGVCPETTWSYNVDKFADKPSAEAYAEGAQHKVLANKRVPVSTDGLKTLINMGFPVAFGFTVFAYFESAEMATTAILKIPGANEQSIGGHAVVCVGYSDTMECNGHTGYIKVRNSWGEGWGQSGYFWMPYTYVNMGLVSDCWAVTQNENDLVNANKKICEGCVA